MIDALFRVSRNKIEMILSHKKEEEEKKKKLKIIYKERDSAVEKHVLRDKKKKEKVRGSNRKK